MEKCGAISFEQLMVCLFGNHYSEASLPLLYAGQRFVRILTESHCEGNNEDDQTHGNTASYQEHLLHGEQGELSVTNNESGDAAKTDRTGRKGKGKKRLNTFERKKREMQTKRKKSKRRI